MSTKSEQWSAIPKQPTGQIWLFNGQYDRDSSWYWIYVDVSSIVAELNASTLPKKPKKTQKPLNRFWNRYVSQPKNVGFLKIRSTLIMEWNNQPSDRVVEVQEWLVVDLLRPKVASVAFFSKNRGKKQKNRRDKNRRFLYINFYSVFPRAFSVFFVFYYYLRRDIFSVKSSDKIVVKITYLCFLLQQQHRRTKNNKMLYLQRFIGIWYYFLRKW
jgi:hypothetical protein